MPVVVLSTVAGFQVPVIPFEEVAGNTGATEPGHIAGIEANVGVICGLTVTVNVVVVAHRPAVGVNVYVPVFVLSTVEGVQVPVTPLLDVVGSEGAADPLHIAGTAVNVGVTKGLTVTTTVAGVAQSPAVGVNV